MTLSRRILLCAAVLICAPGLAHADCTIPPVATKGITGFQEAVLSVSDLAAATATWREVGEYEVVCEGKAGADVAAFWGQDKAVAIDEVVLRKPGLSRGFLRLVKFNGVPQRQIRSSGMSWDTGGIFDLYMYVEDLQTVFDQLRARGWQAYTDPVTYTLGPFTVTEAIMRGPNGEALCLMQRDAPPYNKADFGLTAGKKTGIGWPFNAALVSKEFEPGHKLFGDILGWKIHLEGNSASQPPGDNPLGLPKTLAQTAARKFAAYAPHPTDRNGSIQVLTNVGVEGRDFSDRAEPPNLGILTLRVPVPDLKKFASEVTKKGGQIAVPARTVNLPPYGAVDILALKAPNGARIEFFAKK